MVEDLVKALDNFNVPAQEKNNLLAALGPPKPQIVGVNAQTIGTELPKKFKPAPPLGSEKDMKMNKKMGKDAEKMNKKDKSDKKDKKDKAN